MDNRQDSRVKGILGEFEDRLETFGGDERGHQLSVKLKSKYGAVIERMKGILDERIKVKRANGADGEKSGKKEATKAEAVEQLFDLAEKLLDLREAQRRVTKTDG